LLQQLVTNEAKNKVKDWTLNPLKKLVTNLRKNNVKDWTLNPKKKKLVTNVSKK